MTEKPKTPEDAKSNVIQFKAQKPSARASEAKWGKSVMDVGYCIVPSILFRAQSRLGLSGMQLVVLLQLHEFWWRSDQLPYPAKETLAKRMNVSDKTVQRITRELEAAGYIKRMPRNSHRGQTSNAIDFSGLVKKLKELTPEFAEAKAAPRKVERRGGLKAKAQTA